MKAKIQRERPQGEPTVSIIVPALSEAENLRLLLPTLPPGAEVVVIEGHPPDHTREVIEEIRPHTVLIEQTRRGKGNAVACGVAAATGDIIVMFDADGSARPEEIEVFVAALRAGADFVKGTRMRPGGGSDDLTHLRRAGNWVLTQVANVLLGSRYSDLCYGYNAFWRDVVPVLRLPDPTSSDDEMLWGEGFEIETLINCRIALARLHVAEVPSWELDRVHGVTNLHAWRDGRRVLRTLLTERQAKGRARSALRDARPPTVGTLTTPPAIHRDS